MLKIKPVHFFLILAIGLVVAGMGRRVHRKGWSMLRSDTEGYYLYLPGVFTTGFRDIPVRTPSEFVKTPSGLYFTRFNYGVALAEAPLFLLTLAGYKLVAPELPVTGYELPFEFSLILTHCLLTIFGLWLLGKALSPKFNYKILLFLIVILGGTSLFYYGVYDGAGHSHSLSFFLVSLIIYISPRLWTNDKHIPLQAACIWLIAASIMILIRPTNFLIAACPLVLHVHGREALFSRLKKLFHPRFLLLGILIFGVVFFPQLLYYKLSQGSWLINPHNPDGSFESFPYLKNPHWMEVLFDVRNGFFIYAPFMLLFFPAWLYVHINRKTERLQNNYIMLAFLLQVYTIASWYMYWFGGYGHRGFIDILPLLCVSLYPYYELIWDSGRWKKALIITASIVAVYLGTGMSFKYRWPWQAPYFSWKEYGNVYLALLQGDFSQYAGKPN